MLKQPAVHGRRDAMKKKQTWREMFLSEMDAVVPWGRVLALIAPNDPKARQKGGRLPMLRVYFLQNWYALSDPMAEETLYDSEAIDIGVGDSFADIYGSSRLVRIFILKFLTHLARTPLVMAPQTIGPFTKPLSLSLIHI